MTPVAVIENDQVYFIRTDHIGRPIFATDANGTKVWEATYLPFGGIHTTSGDVIGLRFPGQWFQSESGLHQNWMRDYDPTTGRYIQADPLGLVDGASVYGYALQNPGRYSDPRGEQSIQFDGSTVKVYDSNRQLQGSYPAVSGTAESCQCSQDMGRGSFGPIPEGAYTVDPADTNRRNFIKALRGWGPTSAWGRQRTIIKPNGHNALGRTGMYMHGGKFPGSIGCVDLTKHNDAFHKWLRQQSGPVPMTVDYPDNDLAD
nr:RHS repeat-associated core domain-containing protein [Pseudaestuariivita rosea]